MDVGEWVGPTESVSAFQQMEKRACGPVDIFTIMKLRECCTDTWQEGLLISLSWWVR